MREREAEASHLRFELADWRTVMQIKHRKLEDAFALLSEAAIERGALKSEIEQLEDQLSVSKIMLARWSEELTELMSLIEHEVAEKSEKEALMQAEARAAIEEAEKAEEEAWAQAEAQAAIAAAAKAEADAWAQAEADF